MVKIIATSDFHGELPTIDECDLLLIAGDICPEGSPQNQAHWLRDVFQPWLLEVPAKKIVGVAGNHDFVFAKRDLLSLPQLNWHYLEDDWTELFGLKIYGTPWQPPFWGAFNLIESELEKRYAKIPSDIDILVSHSPPYGILDAVYSPTTEEMLCTGSLALRKYVFAIKPQLFVCGHIHCGYGSCTIDGIHFVNVSLLDDDMEVANQPMQFLI